MKRIPRLAVDITFVLVAMLASAQTPGAQAAPKQQQATSSAKAATSQPVTPRDMRYYVIANGDDVSGSWDSENSPNTQEMRSRYGEHFAWFREGGREYVITDPVVMAELEKAMEPQKKVNLMQADVNREESRVNDLQAKVNAHQKDVNAAQQEVNARQNIANQVQSAVSNGSNAAVIDKLEAGLRELRAKPEVNQSSVNQMQSQVNEEQHGVNDEQVKVNAMQRPVNDEQRRVSAEFAGRVREIFGAAIEQGTARQIQK
jgi:hypothetical protein